MSNWKRFHFACSEHSSFSIYFFWNFDALLLHSYAGALLHTPCFLFHNGSGATSQKFSCFEGWGIEASKDKVKTQMLLLKWSLFFLIRATGCFENDIFLLIINFLLIKKPCYEDSPNKHSMVSSFYVYKTHQLKIVLMALFIKRRKR